MNKTKQEIFSQNLRYYMKLRMKSRKDISNETEIPYTSIRDYEKGYCYAKQDKIEKIAKSLKISPFMLIEEHNIDDIINVIDNTEDDKLITEIIVKVSKLGTEEKKEILKILDFICNKNK